MAGMYPDNQSIELFGETVSWPGLDNDGKFTNGSFSDPAVRPSFIPAETLNLILDNLSGLLISLGKVPNNTDPSQLEETFTAVLAQKADIDSPELTGIPKVPGKTTAAINDGTLIATEAQVALKANIASPAFTNTPTAPTAAAKNNSTQIATTAYADRAAHPVGSYYTQYPVAGQSTIANMLPASESPATLFGGTWSEMYIGENVFFRTAGTSAETGNSDGNRRGYIWDNTAKAYISDGGTTGVQPDAIRNFMGTVDFYQDACLNNSEGVFTISTFSGTVNAHNSSNSSGRRRFNFNPALEVPTDITNHPKNRLIKVWKRTA